MPDIIPKPAHLSPHPGPFGRAAILSDSPLPSMEVGKAQPLIGTERGLTEIEWSPSNPKSGSPFATRRCGSTRWRRHCSLPVSQKVISTSPDISHYCGIVAEPSSGFFPGFHRTHVAVAR